MASIQRPVHSACQRSMSWPRRYGLNSHADFGSAATRRSFVGCIHQEGVVEAGLDAAIVGQLPQTPSAVHLRGGSSSISAITPGGSSVQASAASFARGISNPSSAICRDRSSIRSCSRGMSQTRAVAGGRAGRRLAGHQDRREHVGVLENLLGVAEVHDRFHPGRLREEPPQRLAVAGLHPLVRHDEAEPAAGLQQAHSQLVKVDVEVGRPVIGAVVLLQIGLVFAKSIPAARTAGWPTTTSKPPSANTSGKAARQSSALGMDRRVGDRRCCRRGRCGRGSSAPCRPAPS